MVVQVRVTKNCKVEPDMYFINHINKKTKLVKYCKFYIQMQFNNVC